MAFFTQHSSLSRDPCDIHLQYTSMLALSPRSSCTSCFTTLNLFICFLFYVYLGSSVVFLFPSSCVFCLSMPSHFPPPSCSVIIVNCPISSWLGLLATELHHLCCCFNQNQREMERETDFVCVLNGFDSETVCVYTTGMSWWHTNPFLMWFSKDFQRRGLFQVNMT